MAGVGGVGVEMQDTEQIWLDLLRGGRSGQRLILQEREVSMFHGGRGSSRVVTGRPEHKGTKR